ncbi:IS110 family transposase, partial [Bacillus dakarensis]
MDFKQNQKINQVTEKTLVVGIDIAKRKHFACFVDDRGRVLQKSFSVLQSSDGFQSFYQRILAAMKEYEKTEVIVGIEP